MKSLWPREHGAYVQLLAPLATALVLRTPAPAALLIAAGACLAFVASEPVRVLLGHRGARRREVDAARAKRRAAFAAIGAVVCGATGLVLAPEARVAALAIAVPVLVAGVLAWRRAMHSVAGEIVAAVALSGASVPVAVASGAALRGVLALWLAWCAGYAATVLAVHRVIAHHKSRGDRITAAVLAGALVAAAAVSLHQPLALVALPLIALSAGVALRPPPATRLRAIGVALTIASVAAGALAFGVT